MHPTPRNTDDALRRALALDDDELAFLSAAALPVRLAASVAAAQRRSLAIDLLWIAFPAALMYAGWLLAAPLVSASLAVAGQAGVTTLVAAQTSRVLWGALNGFASLVEAASALPGFESPLALIAILAAMTYAAGLATPHVRRQPAAV